VDTRGGGGVRRRSTLDLRGWKGVPVDGNGGDLSPVHLSASDRGHSLAPDLLRRGRCWASFVEGRRS
jgi:hypothetical protein